MKISLNWLADYLPGPLSAADAAEALTHGGLPVEVIETHGDDTVIDVEVTSNRGDCLSHVGVARELAALLNRPFKDLSFKLDEAKESAGQHIAVRIDSPELCPHYTARVIRGVKIGPSPNWMQKRLEAVGLRPINNVVDVTNYVMFELGQPLHAFDYDHVGGKQIVVRRAPGGEKLLMLDGKLGELQADYLVIADAAKPLALAGVMGGKESEVSDGTTNILLESARFDPLSVRKAARAIVRSDSSYRFERGIDPLVTEIASRRAAQLITQIAGGQVLSGVVEAGSAGNTPKKLTLRMARLKQLLGVDFAVDRVMEALTRLRLSPVMVGTQTRSVSTEASRQMPASENAGGTPAPQLRSAGGTPALQGPTIEVTVPSYRLDLNIEVDLIEEVARIIGYSQIPVRDEIAIRVTPADPKAKTIEIINDTLVSAGYFEALTVGFISDLLAKDFVPPTADSVNPLPRASAVTRKDNASLRPSILPGLLESVRRNDHAGTKDAKLFEMGSTFYNAPSGTVVERQMLGVVGSSDLREVRGAIEAMLARLEARRSVLVVPENQPGFGRGVAGRVEWGGVVIGRIGRVAKEVADKLSLRDRPCAAELDVAALLAGAQLVPQLEPLPEYPAAERDLSLVVPDAVRYEAIESLVRKAQPANLESVRFVTTYRGKPLEKGTKSVTLKFVFRSGTGTLTGEAVEEAVGGVVEQAKKELGAILRA